MNAFRLMAAGAAIALLAASISRAVAASPRPSALEEIRGSRPNVLVILLDDLGFSDVGAFGGEIRTPNIDKLAKSGSRMTNFHSAPACSPTRAELLTGVDHHLAGIGAMTEASTPELRSKPGYAGYLRADVPTIAERLKAAGYETFMTGKWHVGFEPGQGPSDRGFDHSFVNLIGSGQSFSNAFDSRPRGKAATDASGKIATTLRENGNPPDGLPPDYYASNYFTSKLMGYLAARDRAKPFFAYLAFQAPHWPLQAPPSYIAKYRGRYDKGPDALLKSRIARMRQIGIIPSNVKMTDIPATVAKWDALTPEQKRLSARKMEVYAAMVDCVDENIGRLMAQLRRSGDLDKTFILFMSDNGAEGSDYSVIPMADGKSFGEFADTHFDNSLDAIGSRTSYVWYGPHWAHAAMAPFNLVKTYTTEGGTRVPAIIHYPGLKRHGVIDPMFMSVLDVVPTILDLAGAPAEAKPGIPPVEGQSLLPRLTGLADAVHPADEMIGWELHGSKAVQVGKWKAVYSLIGTNARGIDPHAAGANRWQLFDIVADPGETHDLSAAKPNEMQKMQSAWQSYAARVGVQPWVDVPLKF